MRLRYLHTIRETQFQLIRWPVSHLLGETERHELSGCIPICA